MGAGIQPRADSPVVALEERILSPDARAFVADLHRRFDARRLALLEQRTRRQRALDAGMRPDFLEETRDIRESEWTVAATPADLLDRRVEITGPVERKMMINGLNSGARAFMADFEDALSPTWENVLAGQANLIDATRRTLAFTSAEGKPYRLAERTATLIVRPRGWHLTDAHFVVDGEPVSGSLLDFGLHFFHNAHESIARGTAPYYYLPKLESHHEARLWNDVFVAAQEALGIPRGTIRATVLIETILAAFEMDEILHALREHAAGLNAGRWDYIFSIIKRFRNDPGFVLPDRGRVTMTAPFMRAYCELLVETCHRRGAHAIGGMAAFIPSRRDPVVNEQAIGKVREDKLREARAGFDGTWVAHPDLVPIAMAVFDEQLGDRPHQRDRRGAEVRVRSTDLLSVRIEETAVTEDGIRQNVRIALLYLASWLQGSGAVAIDNLMEDTATAEISRAQLWQWRRHGILTLDAYRAVRAEQVAQLEHAHGSAGQTLRDAAELLDRLVESSEFAEFLTPAAGEFLDRNREEQ